MGHPFPRKNYAFPWGIRTPFNAFGSLGPPDPGMVVALVLSRLDYGQATLAGLPAWLLNCVQSVLNAVVRSIAGLRLAAWCSGYSVVRRVNEVTLRRARLVLG